MSSVNVQNISELVRFAEQNVNPEDLPDKPLCNTDSKMVDAFAQHNNLQAPE